MSPFLPSFGNLYILIAMNYVSKWVEEIACPRNDAILLWGHSKKHLEQIWSTKDHNK